MNRFISICEPSLPGLVIFFRRCSDPAHVPFAHHGVIGSRAMGTPMDIVMDDEAGKGTQSKKLFLEMFPNFIRTAFIYRNATNQACSCEMMCSSKVRSPGILGMGILHWVNGQRAHARGNTAAPPRRGRRGQKIQGYLLRYFIFALP